MKYAVIFERFNGPFSGEAYSLCKNTFSAENDKEALLKVINKHLYTLEGEDLADYRAKDEAELVEALTDLADDTQDILYQVQNLTNGRVLFDNIETDEDCDDEYEFEEEDEE